MVSVLSDGCIEYIPLRGEKCIEQKCRDECLKRHGPQAVGSCVPDPRTCTCNYPC